MRLCPILLALGLLLPACGTSDPRELTAEGEKALASGDAQAALVDFEEALGQLKPGDPGFAQASIGRFKALVRVEPELARDDFLAYAKAQSATIGEGDFAIMVGEFLRRERTLEAVDVMDAGVKAFPKSKEMLAVRKKVEEQARASKDPAAMQKMKGLGYVGDEK
jgi:hypothetical protein